jgi:hypothetical protein
VNITKLPGAKSKKLSKMGNIILILTHWIALFYMYLFPWFPPKVPPFYINKDGKFTHKHNQRHLYGQLTDLLSDGKLAKEGGNNFSQICLLRYLPVLNFTRFNTSIFLIDQFIKLLSPFRAVDRSPYQIGLTNKHIHIFILSKMQMALRKKEGKWHKINQEYQITIEFIIHNSFIHSSFNQFLKRLHQVTMCCSI